MVKPHVYSSMMKNTNNLNTDTMTRYNGWSNYATWRVNLELFSNLLPEDVTGDMNVDVSKLANALKEYAEELIEEGSSEKLARDYALAFLSRQKRSFLSDVDWQEIAMGMTDDGDGTDGQDRESYSDTQDRESYTVSAVD